jgi:hypothetical protein
MLYTPASETYGHAAQQNSLILETESNENLMNIKACHPLVLPMILSVFLAVCNPAVAPATEPETSRTLQ